MEIIDELLALYEEAQKDCDEQTAEAFELLAFNIRLSKIYKRQKAQDSKEK